MKKFIQRLFIKEGLEKRPIIKELKVEHWNLNIDELSMNEHQAKWTVSLNYETSLWIYESINAPEQYIKERLLKEISWQIYGDCERLLNHLRKSIIKKESEEYLLEITHELEREIAGE